MLYFYPAFQFPLTLMILSDPMRKYLSMLLGFAIAFPLAAIAVCQDDVVSSWNELKGLPGVVIQEKDGAPIGIDFRKCNESWIGSFPKLMDLPSLQSVTMTGPVATHERIIALAAMPNLRALRLDQSLVSDATVAEISKFPKLEDLNLESCDISDAGMLSIAKRESLKRLRVAKTKITDVGLSHIKEMRQLELLDLSDCNKITSDGLANLKGLTKLRNLSLGSPLISDSGLQHLAPLTSMVAISFKDCGIGDTHFDALASMSKLKEFDIFKTRAGDRALGTVANAKEITKLKLRDSAVTNQGLMFQIAKFENLTSLDLGETETSDQALIAIGKLSKLEDLNLLRTKVTSAGIASLTELKLKRLNLDDISMIGDDVVAHVAKIPSLEFLHLGKTAITDKGLRGLIPLANLKDLILNSTAVSDSAMKDLKSKLPKVKIQK
jgi:Leucine-rich repeat (LRR) protein